MPIAMNVHSSQTRGHVSEGEDLEPTPEDRIHHECRADVRDDEKHLADRAETYARVTPSARHELRGMQDGVVEEHPCDAEDERGEIQRAENHRRPPS